VRAPQLAVLAVAAACAGAAPAAPAAVDAPRGNGAIAFVELGPGLPWAIRAVEPDGSGVRTLLSSWGIPSFSGIAWALDGSWLAYSSAYRTTTSRGPDLHLVRADGSGERAVAAADDLHRDPAWSPDGRSLAYVAHGDAGTGRARSLQVIDLESGESRAVAAADGVPANVGSPPAWSPDGGSIAFSWGGDLLVAPSTGGPRRPLTFGLATESPAWSPDGGWIAFVRSEQEPGVYVVRPDGSQLRRVSEAAAGPPRWSPDARTLLYAAQRKLSSGARIASLNVADVRGGDETVLVRGGIHSAVWSPDGTRVAFVRPGWVGPFRNARPTGAIVVANADGTCRTRLTEGTTEGEIRVPRSLAWRPISGRAPTAPTLCTDLGLHESELESTRGPYRGERGRGEYVFRLRITNDGNEDAGPVHVSGRTRTEIVAVATRGAMSSSGSPATTSSAAAPGTTRSSGARAAICSSAAAATTSSKPVMGSATRFAVRPGFDTVVADRHDVVAADCEVVERR
jgi:Tol biopolymer transport system component